MVMYMKLAFSIAANSIQNTDFSIFFLCLSDKWNCSLNTNCKKNYISKNRQLDNFAQILDMMFECCLTVHKKDINYMMSYFEVTTLEKGQETLLRTLIISVDSFLLKGTRGVYISYTLFNVAFWNKYLSMKPKQDAWKIMCSKNYAK